MHRWAAAERSVKVAQALQRARPPEVPDDDQRREGDCDDECSFPRHVSTPERCHSYARVSRMVRREAARAGSALAAALPTSATASQAGSAMGERVSGNEAPKSTWPMAAPSSVDSSSAKATAASQLEPPTKRASATTVQITRAGVA